jgi:hypothetical protein
LFVAGEATSKPLSRLREREGPAAKRWEGEGLLLFLLGKKKKTLT